MIDIQGDDKKGRWGQCHGNNDKKHCESLCHVSVGACKCVSLVAQIKPTASKTPRNYYAGGCITYIYSNKKDIIIILFVSWLTCCIIWGVKLLSIAYNLWVKLEILFFFQFWTMKKMFDKKNISVKTCQIIAPVCVLHAVKPTLQVMLMLHSE